MVGMLVIVKWGQSAQPALARVVAEAGTERVRVQKWRPAVKWNEAPRIWSQPRAIPLADVLRDATDEDVERYGIYRGCGLCYGADPACGCNPARAAEDIDPVVEGADDEERLEDEESGDPWDDEEED